MKSLKWIVFVTLFLVLLAVTIRGCGKITSDPDFTLGTGETISGNLFVLSNNAVLEKDSTVDGSMVMLCCNLIIDGRVNGDILLITGNLRLDTYADVKGNVNVLSGNVWP